MLLILFLLSDAKLVPMMSEQAIEKPEDMSSNADTGYETSSVVSASSSSQVYN